MIINTCENFEPVCATKAPRVGAYVAEPGRSISVSPDIARALGLSPGSPVEVAPHVLLTGLDLGHLDPAEAKALNGMVDKTIGAIMSDIENSNPVAGLIVDGYELCIATKGAFKAWKDPERDSIGKAGAKTAKAMGELIDALSRVVPGLAGNRYVGMASLCFSIGGRAFQFYGDYWDGDDAAPVAFGTGSGSGSGLRP